MIECTSTRDIDLFIHDIMASNDNQRQSLHDISTDGRDEELLQPPSRRWDRQSLSDVRNFIFQASEFIDARLRVQQMLKSLVHHLEKGNAPPEIREEYAERYVGLFDPAEFGLDYSDMFDGFAMEFSTLLKDEYARVINIAREDLLAAKESARQVMRESVMEGREDGMALELYNTFCRAAERRAEPQKRRRRRMNRD